MVSDPVRRLPVPQLTVSDRADKARAFGEAIAHAKGKHLLVPLRGHPDPDGIASALAHGHLALRQGVASTTIAYCHELSHRENRALVKLLGLDLRKVKSVKEIGHADFISLVDAHDLDPDLADAEGIEVLSIVDHHRAPSPPRARFVDLRHEVGATATIYVEYLEQLAPLDVDSEDDRRIATALMHGLATDTDDFMLARATDFRAAAQIAEVLDRDLLADLSRRLIAPSAMDVMARALAALVVRRNFATAGVGFVSEGDRDTIAQAADFLVRREDIDTVVVYAVVGDKTIEGSLRTHSPSVDPAAWLESAFGCDEKGRAYGGGRRDKGGFRIPIGFLGRSTDRAQLWTLVEHAMRSALLRMVGDEAGTGVHGVAPTT
jgi:nanoRNase/pAp phosphatase (c-di-AMP/oligoRNAs hydrolase)